MLVAFVAGGVACTLRHFARPQPHRARQTAAYNPPRAFVANVARLRAYDSSSNTQFDISKSHDLGASTRTLARAYATFATPALGVCAAEKAGTPGHGLHRRDAAGSEKASRQLQYPGLQPPPHRAMVARYCRGTGQLLAGSFPGNVAADVEPARRTELPAMSER